MTDIQIAVSALMTLLLDGGPDAASDLIKGMVVKGAEAVSKIWHELFSAKPDSRVLAERVAADPTDAKANAQLRALLEELLSQRPELLQQTITTGAIRAEGGSIAAAVVNNGNLTINNR